MSEFSTLPLPEPPEAPGPEKPSVKAVAAMWVGVASLLFCLPLPLAVILAVLALIEARREGRRRAAVRAYVALALCALAVCWWYFLRQNFLAAHDRSHVSRVRADSRSIATALEIYAVDHGAFPAWGTGNQGANAFVGKGSPAWDIPTFRLYVPGNAALQAHSITTPVAYNTSHFPDPYAEERGVAFGYYVTTNRDTGQSGWILFSGGLDRDYDIDPIRDFMPGEEQRLINLTYDPSNGTYSNGDLIRLWR